jgi:hypothetical protein
MMNRYRYASPLSFSLSTGPESIGAVLGFDFSHLFDSKHEFSVPFYGDLDYTEPSTWLRVLPYTGVTGFLYETFPYIIALGAEIALTAAPGLVEGKDFTQALVSEYGARLKIVLTYYTAAALAAASTAAGPYLAGLGIVGTAVGTQLSDEAKKQISDFNYDELVNKLEDFALKELGETKTNEIKDQANTQVDQQINQAFTGLMQNPDFTNAFNPYLALRNEKLGPAAPIPPPWFDPTKLKLSTTDPAAVAIRSLYNPSSTSSQNLKKLGLSPADLAAKFNVREDVAALATNTILQQRIYDLSPTSFDVVTGKQTADVTNEDRTQGDNASWALVDLQKAQSANAPQNILDGLQANYARALRVQSAPGEQLDPKDVLAELEIARQRGASPDVVRMYEDKYTTASRQPSLDVGVQQQLPKHGLPMGGAPAGGQGFSIAPASLNLKDLPAFALVTAPFWIMLLLLRSRSRRPPSAVRRRRGRT